MLNYQKIKKFLKVPVLNLIFVLFVQLDLMVFNWSLFNEGSKFYQILIFLVLYVLILEFILIGLNKLMKLSLNKNEMYTYLFMITSLLVPFILLKIFNTTNVNVNLAGYLVIMAAILVNHYRVEIIFKLRKKSK